MMAILAIATRSRKKSDPETSWVEKGCDFASSSVVDANFPPHACNELLAPDFSALYLEADGFR